MEIDGSFKEISYLSCFLPSFTINHPYYISELQKCNNFKPLQARHRQGYRLIITYYIFILKSIYISQRSYKDAIIEYIYNS